MLHRACPRRQGLTLLSAAQACLYPSNPARITRSLSELSTFVQQTRPLPALPAGPARPHSLPLKHQANCLYPGHCTGSIVITTVYIPHRRTSHSNSNHTTQHPPWCLQSPSARTASSPSRLFGAALNPSAASRLPSPQPARSVRPRRQALPVPRRP